MSYRNFSFSGVYEFTASTYSGDVKYYSEESCMGDVETEYSFDATYTLGDEVIVESGVTAWKADFIFDIDDEVTFTKGLLYRDGDKLYMGKESEDDVRPADIDFGWYLTLQ